MPDEEALPESSSLPGAGYLHRRTHPNSSFYQSLEFFIKPWVEGINMGSLFIWSFKEVNLLKTLCSMFTPTSYLETTLDF